MPRRKSKLARYCKNIMLICGTITSIVGALGSIANLVVSNTRKEIMMRMPAPAPDDAYLDGLGRGGPSVPIYEPFDWLGVMPEVFLVGVIIVAIALFLMRRERKVIIGSEL